MALKYHPDKQDTFTEEQKQQWHKVQFKRDSECL